MLMELYYSGRDLDIIKVKVEHSMSDKLYRGVRQGYVPKVYVDNTKLSLEQANILHPSDATFEWGYFGNGPSQTSLAILYDAIEDMPNSRELALKYYQDFKECFIANVEYNIGFAILESQIKDWLYEQMWGKEEKQEDNFDDPDEGPKK